MVTARPARQAVERTTPAAGPPASATRRGAAWTLTASFHDRDRISYPALLEIPYFLSPGWLKIDPTFEPLRGNPRFDRLMNGPP